MLIDLSKEINFGDIVIDNKGNHFLVVRNTFDTHFSTMLVNLHTNRVEDEYYRIESIKEGIDIVGVVPSRDIEIRRFKENDKG